VAGGTAGPVRRMRGPETAGGLAGCPPVSPSLRKSRTHATWVRLFSSEGRGNRYLASRVPLPAADIGKAGYRLGLDA
jgi:hypothetical protein